MSIEVQLAVTCSLCGVVKTKVLTPQEACQNYLCPTNLVFTTEKLGILTLQVEAAHGLKRNTHLCLPCVNIAVKALQTYERAVRVLAGNEIRKGTLVGVKQDGTGNQVAYPIDGGIYTEVEARRSEQELVNGGQVDPT